MPNPELELEVTAYTADQLTFTDVPQLALAGRSNVGKSSLINALAGRRALAKVSSTPGKTRSVNCYKVKPWGFRLVDLPGYGYAKASHSERESWRKLLEKYLRDCENLKTLVLLLDGRLEPQQLDKDLVAFARSLDLRVLPVLTKADKCKQREIAHRQNQWQSIIGTRPVITSSEKRFGMKNLWTAMLEELGIEDEAYTRKPPQEQSGMATTTDVASTTSTDATPEA